MRSSAVQLRDVDSENWREIVELSVDQSQIDFISSNLFSLAQSKFETCRTPSAIYNLNGILVGFAMYNGRPLPDGSYRISRLMIDAKHQGNGYGAAAAKQIVELLSQVSECKEIKLDYHPENKSASVLWRNLGFVECERVGENIELCLQVN